MAVIVEDGSVVANANSYVTRAEYIGYAAELGVTIPNDDAADVHLVKAANFINDQEIRLKGKKVSRDQSLAWPREGVEIEGWNWSSTEIPRQVLLCQLALALDINSGIDLWNRNKSADPVVKRKRVEGAVEIEYAVSDNAAQLGRASTSGALLRALYKRSGLVLIRS